MTTNNDDVVLTLRCEFGPKERPWCVCGAAALIEPKAKPAIVWIERSDNPGRSTTNSAEEIAPILLDMLAPGLTLDDADFYEAYGYRLGLHAGVDPLLSRCTFVRGTPGGAVHPQWRIATPQERAVIDPLTIEWLAQEMRAEVDRGK